MLAAWTAMRTLGLGAAVADCVARVLANALTPPLKTMLQIGGSDCPDRLQGGSDASVEPAVSMCTRRVLATLTLQKPYVDFCSVLLQLEHPDVRHEHGSGYSIAAGL
jgi:hypothetical protein